MVGIKSPSHAMNMLAGVRRSLAKSADLNKLQDLRQQATVIYHFLRMAAEVRLLCQRRLGQVLSELSLAGGDRLSKNRKPYVKLADWGISRTESARWQQEASVPDKDFARYVRQVKSEGRELTAGGLRQLAKLHAVEKTPAPEDSGVFAPLIASLRSLARQQKRFATIYADPPWHDDTMKLGRLRKCLCRLPVKQVAAKRAHLHLWVPPELLESGIAVLRAWGFRYESLLVRRKPPAERGDYWRSAHDMLLLGVRGELPFRDAKLSGWMDAVGGRNSADKMRDLIALVSPSAYLDLFGRTKMKGWRILS
jgi:N6-adenosine-specific RNA methylase IME4